MRQRVKNHSSPPVHEGKVWLQSNFNDVNARLAAMTGSLDVFIAKIELVKQKLFDSLFIYNSVLLVHDAKKGSTTDFEIAQ